MGEMADLIADYADGDYLYSDAYVEEHVTCKYCGVKDLFWGTHLGQRRLFSENGVHCCVDKYLDSHFKKG